MEAEHVCDEDCGELLDAIVQFLRCAVEEATNGCEFVLDVADLGLQLHEVLVGFQVGISLGNGLQVHHSVRQLLLGCNLVVDGRCVHSCGASLSHSLEHFLLVSGIALHGCYELRNQVVTLLQLNVDVGERILTIVTQTYQVVVDADNPKNKQYDDCKNDNCYCTHNDNYDLIILHLIFTLILLLFMYHKSVAKLRKKDEKSVKTGG